MFAWCLLAKTSIVLLPGLDGTGKLFARFIVAAPSQFAVTSIALPPAALSYNELADHVAGKLPVGEPLVLIAESFSGPLALALAVRRPIAALVLCNSFVVAPRARALRWFIWSVFLELPLPRFFVRRYMLGAAADDAQVDDVAGVIKSVPASVLAVRLRCVLNTDDTKSFARSTVPTLYIRGTEDRLVPESSSRRMAAIRPMSIVHVPEPHFLLQVNPVGAWNAVTSFLKSLPAV